MQRYNLYELRATPRLFDELFPFKPPPPLVQRHAAPSEQEQDRQVSQREGLRLKDRLEERDIDEGELNEERDRDGEEEHLVRVAGEERDVQPSVLQRGCQIKEDKGSEGLRGCEPVSVWPDAGVRQTKECTIV